MNNIKTTLQSFCESVKDTDKDEYVKIFNYKIVKTEPLTALDDYKEHRRLRVFYNKGVKCVVDGCNIVGTKLVHGLDNNGAIHIDLVTDDNIPMTIDHILPRSKGGTYDLDNLQPMCSMHNTLKGGNIDESELANMGMPLYSKSSGLFYKATDIKVGDVVYKLSRKSKDKLVLLGTVSEILTNPHDPKGGLGVKVKGNEYSIYDIKKIYRKKN